MPFTVTLDGDSRKSRYQISNEPTYDYEQVIRDSDREILGFTALEVMIPFWKKIYRIQK